MPPEQTRTLRLADLLIAALFGHASGLLIGVALNLTVGQLLGWAEDSGFLIYFGGLTSVALLPVTFCLSLFCSRLGIFGFGASIVTGAAIGAAASASWVEHSVHLPEHIWLGLSVGVPSSSAFWMFLSWKRPQAFAGDPVSTLRFGRVLYGVLALTVVVVPYIPKMIDVNQSKQSFERSVTEFRELLDDARWERAARDGPEEFRAFADAVETQMRSIGLRETMVDNRIGLAEKLMRWSEFEKARSIYWEAAEIGGYPWGNSDPCTYYSRTFQSQALQGDYTGTYLACFQLNYYEVNQCLRCLKTETVQPSGLPEVNFDLPLVLEKEHPTYQFWQFQRMTNLSRNAVSQGLSGSWRADLAIAPEGMMRGDLLTGIAVAYIEAGIHKEALDLTAEAIAEVEHEEGAHRRVLRDSTFRRVSEAWRDVGELNAARQFAERVSDRNIRERMFLRLETYK